MSERDVIDGYRMILGRDPENETVVKLLAERHRSLRGLREDFFNSPEFREIYWSICSERNSRGRTIAEILGSGACSESSVDIRDRTFWTKYLPQAEDTSSPVPFREIGFQRYLTDRGAVVRSMLSSFELTLLYALARDLWNGRGAIVDLGCFYGLTTRCLAKGVADKNLPPTTKNKSVYAFDLFSMDYLWEHAIPSSTSHAGSIFNDFLMLNQDLLRYIVPCPGDIRRMSWSLPIEILFIDCAKSWELNQWVVSRMFPWLMEGSVLVQQDYIHYYEYWTHITMEYYADHFEPLYMMYGGSAAFRCKRAISAEETAVDLASLTLESKEMMLARAIDKAPVPVREVLKCAYAKCLLDHGEIRRAGEMAEAVGTERLTDDPVLDVASIAAANKETVIALVAEQEVKP